MIIMEMSPFQPGVMTISDWLQGGRGKGEGTQHVGVCKRPEEMWKKDMTSEEIPLIYSPEMERSVIYSLQGLAGPQENLESASYWTWKIQSCGLKVLDFRRLVYFS